MRAKADPELAKRLAALGYISGGSIRPNRRIQGSIAIANALHQAVVAVEDGAFQKAIPLLEKVTASDPDIPLAQLQLGIARVRTKQHARAIPPLTRLVSLDPDQQFGQYELGIALYETGDLQGAARISPSSPERCRGGPMRATRWAPSTPASIVWPMRRPSCARRSPSSRVTFARTCSSAAS